MEIDYFVEFEHKGQSLQFDFVAEIEINLDRRCSDNGWHVESVLTDRRNWCPNTKTYTQFGPEIDDVIKEQVQLQIDSILEEDYVLARYRDAMDEERAGAKRVWEVLR